MKVIGTGLSCLDIVHKNKDVIRMNGGTCANVLTVLAQLGEQASILLPDYDDDKQSAHFYDTLEKLGISLIKYCRTTKPIPRIIEVFDENKNHLFYTKCPVCGRDLIRNRFITRKESERLMPEILNQDIFFTDRVSEGIKNIAIQYGNMGKLAMYEPNSGRNLNAVMQMARLVNVIKFSADRINMESADAIRKRCEESTLNLIIVTQGSKGMCFSYRLNEKRFSGWLNGPYIEFSKVEDTSGAGDWLTAGFLYYWDKGGYRLEEGQIYSCLEAGLKLSEICSMTEGAQGAFYDERLVQMLQTKYKIGLNEAMDNEFLSSGINAPGICRGCLMEIM